MKYLVVCVVLLSANGLSAMYEEVSKAEQIRLMQGWIEEAKRLQQGDEPQDAAPKQPESEKVKLARAMPAQEFTRQDVSTTTLNLIEQYADRQYANLEKLYNEAIEVVTMHSYERDMRVLEVLDRQGDTIEHLNELIKRLMTNGSRLRRRVGAQEHELGEFKEGVDQSIGKLLDAVTDQSEMFVKQNTVIRELMRRVEKLTHKNAEQARKYSLQSMALKKIEAAVKELSDKHTEKEMDELLEYFSNVLKGLPDLKETSVAPESFSDAELFRQMNYDPDHAVFRESPLSKSYDADDERSIQSPQSNDKGKDEKDDKGKEEMETVIIEEYEEASN